VKRRKGGQAVALSLAPFMLKIFKPIEKYGRNKPFTVAYQLWTLATLTFSLPTR
jgi:hypothetical protein